MIRISSFKQKESLFHKVEFSRLTNTIASESKRLNLKATKQLVKQIVLMLQTLAPSTRIRELVGNITQGYQQLIEQIHQEFSGETRISEMEEDVRKTNERQQTIATDATVRADDVRQMKGELDDGAEELSSKNNTWKVFQIVLFVLLGLDVIFNYKNFAVLGLTQLVSIAASGLLSIGLYFYVDQVPNIVRKIHERYGIRKIILILLSFIPPTSLFTLLATLRVQYAQTTNESVASNSTIAFIGINSFILLVALIIVFRYKLSKEEKERFDIYNDLKKKINKEELYISNLWEQHQQLGEDLRSRNTIRYNAFQTVSSLERQVELNYNSTCAETKTALLFKSAGKAAFLITNTDEDFPKLKLRYQNLPELFQKYATDREVFKAPNSDMGLGTNKLLLMLLPLILAVSACTQPKSHHAKYVPDMTDSMLAVEQFKNDTTALYARGDRCEPQDAQTVSVDYITDRRLAEDGLRITLPKGSIALLDNELERGKEVDSFIAQSKQITKHIKAQKIGRNSSYILYHLHRCLNELIREQNDYSSLYIFTDAVEQSPYLDLYDSVQYNLFTTTEAYRNSILDKFPLDSLKKNKQLDIHFIYHGKTKAQEERFLAIVGVLAPYYQKRSMRIYTGRSVSGTTLFSRIQPQTMNR